MEAEILQAKATVTGVYGLGTKTVPESIERLGGVGVDWGVVAILRDICYRGGTDFVVTDQYRLAKRLGTSRSTVQKTLKRAIALGFLLRKKSTQKAQARGCLCEYKIDFKIVFERLGYSYSPIGFFASDDSEWIANQASYLPARWFQRAVFVEDELHLVLTSGARYKLPENSDVVLKYLTESHFGGPIEDASLQTFLKTIEHSLTPRLLSLLALKLHHSKSEARTPAYYTRLLKDLYAKSLLEPAPPRARTKTKKTGPSEMIIIEFDIGSEIDVHYRAGSDTTTQSCPGNAPAEAEMEGHDTTAKPPPGAI